MLIENKTLIIRNMNYNDIPLLHNLLSNEKVMKYVEEPFTYDKTEEFAYRNGLSNAPIIFSVDLKDNGFIGYILFKKFLDNDTYEIGWFLLPEYWNKGYASLLTEMLIQHSIAIKIKTLIIELDNNQKISKEIATKFNFKFLKCEDNLLFYSRVL